MVSQLSLAQGAEPLGKAGEQWEAEGTCFGATGAAPDHSCFPLIPLPGHGRAGGGVPAGGEVSRPQPPRTPPWS